MQAAAGLLGSLSPHLSRVKASKANAGQTMVSSSQRKMADQLSNAYVHTQQYSMVHMCWGLGWGGAEGMPASSSGTPYLSFELFLNWKLNNSVNWLASELEVLLLSCP